MHLRGFKSQTSSIFAPTIPISCCALCCDLRPMQTSGSFMLNFARVAPVERKRGYSFSCHGVLPFAADFLLSLEKFRIWVSQLCIIMNNHHPFSNWDIQHMMHERIEMMNFFYDLWPTLFYFLELLRVRFLVCIVTRHGHALAVPKKVARVLARPSCLVITAYGNSMV